MEKDIKKYMYLLVLFAYVMRNQELYKNTAFRLIYIYKVSTAYLNGLTATEDSETIILDERYKEVTDYRLLTAALAMAVSQRYININETKLSPGDDLESFIKDNAGRSKTVKEDIQRISYFADIVFSYGEDVILAILYKEPNYANAANRNRKEISLANNELLQLLTEFENIALSSKHTEDKPYKLEKYDVFIRWLDYVLDGYLKEKNKA